MQQVVKTRILLSRMVRDNLDKTGVKSRTQNHTAETQSQSQRPEEPAGTELNPEKIQPNREEPTERQLDLLHWHKLNFEEAPETWRKVSVCCKCLYNHSLWILLLFGIDF